MKTINQLRWMWFVLLLSCISMAGLTGCEDFFSVFDKSEDSKNVLYEMKGFETITSYSEWPISEGQVPTVQRYGVRFFMLMKVNSRVNNIVRVYGLEGADVGKGDHYFYTDCNALDECKVIGTLDGEDLTIDLQHNGRSFMAEGKVQRFEGSDYSIVEMTATYNYKNTTIQYIFEGSRKKYKK